MAVMDDDAVRPPLHRGDGASQSKPVGEGRRQLLDIAPAAALDRAPHRPVILQQAMVAEERDEVFGGEVQHLGGRRGPDRRAHRREVVGQQARREMPGTEIAAKGQPGQFAFGVIPGALGVEGEDIAEHPQIGRRQQVATSRKQACGGLAPIVAAALPLKAAGVRGHRKAHAAFDGFDAEVGEHGGQIRIVQLVIDDKADIDRQRGAVIVDSHGMAVPAGPDFAIINRDRVTFR